jgi:hypothetical protein
MPPPHAEPAATFDDFPKCFYVTEQSTGTQVLARCIPLTREVARSRIDNVWWHGLPCAKDVRRNEPDLSWSWVDLLGGLKSSKGGGYVRGWAVETDQEGEVQGALLYRTNAISYYKGAEGESIPAVYGAYLAAAPRNRNRLMAPKPGRFRGVGTGLLKLAVAHSHYLNGEGRVNLTSVNHPDTVRLYRRFGFLPVTTVSQDSLVMELPKEAATKYLKEMGLQ